MSERGKAGMASAALTRFAFLCSEAACPAVTRARIAIRTSRQRTLLHFVTITQVSAGNCNSAIVATPRWPAVEYKEA